jgi:hypothetical protein
MTITPIELLSDNVTVGSVNTIINAANAAIAEAAASGGAVSSVNSQTGAVVLDKTDIGLANVDNTADADKPVSDDTQDALDLKADLASPTFTGTVSGITAAMVGLGNVDNTADADKPISDDTQDALDLKQDASGTAAAAQAAVITQVITNGVTDKSPSEDAVFDALATKQPLDTQLTDVAALTYASNALKVVRVNAGETAFELATVSGGGATDIDGLSDAKTNATSVFLGSTSGAAITSGTDNTALGIGAQDVLEDGSRNTAVGKVAMGASISGTDNTAVGYNALLVGTGTNNTAIGSGALDAYDANEGTAVGYNALGANSTGVNNTALGAGALSSVTTGARNTGLGYYAGSSVTGSDNTLIGRSVGSTLTSGTDNILIGSGADVSASGAVNRTVIGKGATCTTDNTVKIGNDSVTDVHFGNDTAILHGDGSALTNLPASSGTVELLATATASASASLDFTSVISSAYSSYIAVIDGIVLSNNTYLLFQNSVDNSTFDATAGDYNTSYQRMAVGSTTITGVAESGTVSGVRIGDATGAASKIIDGTISFNQSTVNNRKLIRFDVFIDPSSVAQWNIGGGQCSNGSASAMNAFRLKPNAGTITSGTVYLYGVKNT